MDWLFSFVCGCIGGLVGFVFALLDNDDDNAGSDSGRSDDSYDYYD